MTIKLRDQPRFPNVRIDVHGCLQRNEVLDVYPPCISPLVGIDSVEGR